VQGPVAQRLANVPFCFRLNQSEESNPQRGWGVRPPAQRWCRLGAVSGVDCRPGCRDMPLYAAICRSLERKSLIFLGLGFFFASQLRWRSASRAKLAREPEDRMLGRPTVGFQASEARPRIPPGVPLFSHSYPIPKCRSPVLESDRAVWSRQIRRKRGLFLPRASRGRRLEEPTHAVLMLRFFSAYSITLFFRLTSR